MFTWDQVRDVVDGVLELPAEERPAYLNRSCAEPHLRSYVESLIFSYENAGKFLEQPALATHANPWERSWIGRRLGTYQIVEEIGHGGMGAVYRAVRADQQYEKQVAIKLVKGGIDPRIAIARFRAERQILAKLEHPNIARLLDGGTTEEGTPFFVMELVDGEPIDRYCDVHALSIPQRLQLFRTVCSAVQYAHQNLVIHRDLKPGNILITADGTPKLLDFGIAKVLSDDAKPGEVDPTLAVGRLLTPEYASPEQVRGETVTTASDVYSLGVVLYFLLTGHRPYVVATHSLDDMARAVCDTPPTRPSNAVRQSRDSTTSSGDTVSITPESISSTRQSAPQKLPRQLAGDLDNILLMALRKEPGRRYASVDQLSEDIRRHLEGRPVHARKDTLGYRVGKFVTRNKTGVAAAVLLVASLAGGLIMSLREAQVAQVQRARAERRFQDVRALANSLMFEIHDGIANLPGSTPVRKVLVERALTYLDSLSKESGDDRSLKAELAAAYERIGNVQGQPRQANLGDAEGATASYKKALAIRQSLVAADPKDIAAQRSLIGDYAWLSDLLWTRGDRDGAMANASKEAEIADQMYATARTNPVSRKTLATAYIDYGMKQAMVGGDREGGLDHLRKGTAILEQIVAESPNAAPQRRTLALAYSRMADILKDDAKTRAEGLQAARKSLAIVQQMIAADPQNADLQRLAAYERYTIAWTLFESGNQRAALAEDSESLSEFQKLAAADPASVQYQQDIALVSGHMGNVLVESGKVQQGLNRLQSSVKFFESQPDSKNPNSRDGYLLVTDQFWIGKAEARLAQSAAGSSAVEHCRQAQSWFDKCIPAYKIWQDTDSIAAAEKEMAPCRTLARK